MELGRFTGPVSAVLTPSVDVEAKTAELVDFHLKNGVNGFFVLGTNGEGVRIHPDKRKRIAEHFIDSVGSKGLVIVHTGAADVDTVIDLTKHASKRGAHAVAVVFPFYYRYDLDSLVSFYTELVKVSDIPVLAYNNPATQGYRVSSHFVENLLERVPGLAGIKDSSNDPELLMSLSRRFPESFFTASGGDELILYSLTIGLRRQVSAIASIYPDLVVGLKKAFESGEKQKALALQHKLNVLKNIIVEAGPYHAACKHALKLRGIDLGGPYPPSRGLTTAEAENLRAKLNEAEKT
ncbi:MAG: dihydrodipicolinate synthase family protein [Candidatus Caldarchaeum sp.]|nr:dihydrodipicolinate synthase family protein [Candidatus Caldarchaeum sp.]